jgi:hypothetical protein
MCTTGPRDSERRRHLQDEGEMATFMDVHSGFVGGTAEELRQAQKQTSR